MDLTTASKRPMTFSRGKENSWKNIDLHDRQFFADGAQPGRL
jgi:hypothetical protein